MSRKDNTKNERKRKKEVIEIDGCKLGVSNDLYGEK